MQITKTVRRVACGVTGLAIVASPVVATAGAAAAKTSSACTTVTDDRWPAWVQGRPARLNPRTTAATYMWHDSDGWHVRVTHHQTNRRTFSGQLVTQGKFVNENVTSWRSVERGCGRPSPGERRGLSAGQREMTNGLLEGCRPLRPITIHFVGLRLPSDS